MRKKEVERKRVKENKRRERWGWETRVTEWHLMEGRRWGGRDGRKRKLNCLLSNGSRVVFSHRVWSINWKNLWTKENGKNHCYCFHQLFERTELRERERENGWDQITFTILFFRHILILQKKESSQKSIREQFLPLFDSLSTVISMREGEKEREERGETLSIRLSHYRKNWIPCKWIVGVNDSLSLNPLSLNSCFLILSPFFPFLSLIQECCKFWKREEVREGERGVKINFLSPFTRNSQKPLD